MWTKRRLIFALVFVVSLSSVAIFAGIIMQRKDLPEAAQTFISMYFPDDEIRKVEKDKGHRGTEYEVDFVSGAEVEFLSDGQWKEVKAAYGYAVPAEIVPPAIYKYVADNFDGLVIVDISRKRGGYEVELSNGTELKLTEDAQPMQMQTQGRKGKR